MEFLIKSLHGNAIQPYLSELARLRISVFRDFPYLYDGSAEYEEQYLKTYTQHADSIVVIALHDDRIIGASTGTPMINEPATVTSVFEQNGLNPANFFYFGESVLEKAYRGHGLGNAFIREREAYAAALGGYTHTTFCAVQRPVTHPLRPPRYRPLDVFWQRHGYVKHPELCAYFRWKDVNETYETEKPMLFWMKRITSRP